MPGSQSSDFCGPYKHAVHLVAALLVAGFCMHVHLTGVLPVLSSCLCSVLAARPHVTVSQWTCVHCRVCVRTLLKVSYAAWIDWPTSVMASTNSSATLLNLLHFLHTRLSWGGALVCSQPTGEAASAIGSGLCVLVHRQYSMVVYPPYFRSIKESFVCGMGVRGLWRREGAFGKQCLCNLGCWLVMSVLFQALLPVPAQVF